MTTTLLLGDCLEELAKLADNSVSSIVTDPPYGLSFMGKKWDYDVPSVDIWRECLRVLKPGGHLLTFAGTRTQHRMAVNIEDAGFEIRDLIAWVYGSGFPKSMNISKAIDKAAGATRKVISEKKTNSGGMAHISKTNAEHGFRPSAYTGNSEDKSAANVIQITEPATTEAAQWEGWGTALKPALEPITVARKPFKGTVAANVLEHGTGGINVDGCRVATGDLPSACKGTGWAAQDRKNAEQGFRPSAYYEGQNGVDYEPNPQGRWPANLIHDGSDEVVGLFPCADSPQPHQTKRSADGGNRTGYGTFNGQENVTIGYDDSGSAARFFYCAKTSKRERGEGNNHPTVKPIALMSYLCRLVTPPGGIILDPFMGSGSTGIAAIKEGFSFIGIERELEYMAIAQRRIEDSENLCD